MHKKFLLIALLLLISTKVYASEIAEQIKSHRTSIYNSLELSSQQVDKIQELDKSFYIEVEPELKKLDYLIKKTHDIAYSDDCTKEAVNNLKKEFKSVEKDMNVIKKGYDKEFIEILSNEQKSKYKLVRKQMRAELKKELEKQRLLQKEQAK